MECESCGSKIEDDESYFVNIEGANLNVCFKCKRFGRLVRAPNPQQGRANPSGSPYQTHRPSSRPEIELIENYGSKIRSAREKMGLPLNVLGEKISEKESFLDRIEKQKTRPPIPVIRKLEKELGIILTEETDNSSAPEEKSFKKSSSHALTLGDILEIERKKKK